MLFSVYNLSRVIISTNKVIQNCLASSVQRNTKVEVYHDHRQRNTIYSATEAPYSHACKIFVQRYCRLLLKSFVSRFRIWVKKSKGEREKDFGSHRANARGKRTNIFNCMSSLKSHPKNYVSLFTWRKFSEINQTRDGDHRNVSWSLKFTFLETESKRR